MDILKGGKRPSYVGQLTVDLVDRRMLEFTGRQTKPNKNGDFEYKYRRVDGLLAMLDATEDEARAISNELVDKNSTKFIGSVSQSFALDLSAKNQLVKETIDFIPMDLFTQP